MFIGSKIFLVNIIGKTPAWISLGVTIGLIVGGVLYSLYKTRPGVGAEASEGRA